MTGRFKPLTRHITHRHSLHAWKPQSVLSTRRNYLKIQIQKSTSINPCQPPSPRMSRELRQCLPLYCSDPSPSGRKKFLRSYKTPERQGAGEGAPGGLRVSPECTWVAARASHCLARACQLPTTSEFGSQSSLPIRYTTLNNVQGPCLKCNALLRGGGLFK